MEFLYRFSIFNEPLLQYCLFVTAQSFLPPLTSGVADATPGFSHSFPGVETPG
jgi:hypothetical protein